MYTIFIDVHFLTFNCLQYTEFQFQKVHPLQTTDQ